MKLLALALALALVLAALAAAPAAAAAIVSASTPGVQSDGTLPVAATITGYAPGQVVPVTAAAHDATATWACPTGNRTATATASPDWSFVEAGADAAGIVRTTVTLAPPATDLACPGHRAPVLVRVTYRDVAVSAPDAGSFGIAGTWTTVALGDGALD